MYPPPAHMRVDLVTPSRYSITHIMLFGCGCFFFCECGVDVCVCVCVCPFLSRGVCVTSQSGCMSSVWVYVPCRQPSHLDMPSILPLSLFLSPPPLPNSSEMTGSDARANVPAREGVLFGVLFASIAKTCCLPRIRLYFRAVYVLYSHMYGISELCAHSELQRAPCLVSISLVFYP